MAKQIARLLKTDVMADIDLPAIAQFLQSQGRRGDSILAHINPREAALLKKMGGAETLNPATGLPEFYNGSGDYGDYISSDSIFKTGVSAPPVSDAYPEEFNRGTAADDMSLSTKAEQQYAGSAFPYPSAGADIPEINWSEALIPGGARDIALSEFPPSSAAYLNLKNIGEFPTREMPVTQEQVDQLTTIGRPAAEAFGPPAPSNVGRTIDDISKALGLTRGELGRLGLAGLGTLQGVMASREAAAQGQQARRETEAIGRPYQERGQELIAQAQRGELTPQGQQSLQALRARLAQGAEARGGVGAAQAAAQVEAFRQNLLQNQFDYGQKISNIGDQIMMGAIRTGLEADRYAANLSNTYFTNMAMIAAGMPTSAERAGGK